MNMDSCWQGCKNVLCIRPDNMGDLLMSSPAIRALKKSFNCKITVLTSSMASKVAKYIPCIDEVMIYETPWVKSNNPEAIEAFNQTVKRLKERQFDAAVIFTVYSQNPMPSVMMAYLAGVPRRLAYSRENPYSLVTHWVPDKEPYSFIQHQVRRDLLLVKTIGAVTQEDKLQLRVPHEITSVVRNKLESAGVRVNQPWIIVHAGVSEKKREYPIDLWIEAGKKIIHETGYQLLLTGSSAEKKMAGKIQTEIGAGAFNVAGLFSVAEFINLISLSSLVLSVNTGTIHIAAAVATPVIVLYALTNPQHSPWRAKGKVLLFDVPQGMQSKNEVVRFVNENLHPQDLNMITPDEIVEAIKQVLLGGDHLTIPEMIPLRNLSEQFF